MLEFYHDVVIAHNVGAVRNEHDFSFLRTKHIPLCTKPVFLDFGGMIVEVESFTDAMAKLDGYGMTRMTAWFADRFLSSKLRPGGLRSLSHGAQSSVDSP